MRATGLPKARDQLLRFLDDPGSALRRGSSEENLPGLLQTANHLRVADLYWVAPDMAALAMSAGADLAAARWAVADRPSPCGLIVFDGGIGQTRIQGDDFPVDALSWGPDENGCSVALWLLRSRLQDALDRRNDPMTLVVEEVPPLVPIIATVLPVTDEPVSMAELDEWTSVSVVSALAAAWLLMQQPNLVEHTRERPDKSVRRAYARAGRSDPEVTVVDLRRQYVPQTGEPTGADGTRYRHRWVVSGHWRNQTYGPRNSLRRQTWIPAYVKGPDGAPMLATEKVNVWRR